MKPAAGVFVVLGLIMAGCAPTHSVAVTSYHAVTAPVRMVHRAIAGKSADKTATNSDVTTPGRQIAAVTPTPTPQPRMVRRDSSVSTSRRTSHASRTRTAAKPSPSPSLRAVSKQPQFPVARAVPGKPGIVYNPFDPNGALIDVSGYPPGSKVKDPDSQKIFVVP
jgi:hypothetical protein